MKRRQRRKLASSQFWVALVLQIIWWLFWACLFLPQTISQLTLHWSTTRFVLFLLGSLIMLAGLVATLIIGVKQGRFQQLGATLKELRSRK